jgi:surface antigen
MLLASLAACGGQRPVPLGSLPPARLPTYGLGDSYQFSDGSSARVIAVDGDAVRWRASDGGVFVTSRDVLLPRLAWTESTMQGDRRISPEAGQMFPLEAGKKVRFTATRNVLPQKGGQVVSAQEDWACEVAGAARVTTRVGDFDTWHVDCTMRETPETSGGGLVHRSFYYAPDIGFYVRTEESLGSGAPQVAELVGYTSSDPILANSALRQRSIELQRALEREVSGNQVTWTDPETGVSGVVALLDTRRSSQYGWCRDFAELIRWSGRVYSLHGTGCRNSAKVWDIVAMASGLGGARLTMP